MKVNFAETLLSLKGEPLKEGDEWVTVGGVVGNLLSVFPSDDKIKAAERKKRFLLSIKVYQATLPVEIDDADVSLIKELLENSRMPPLYSEQIVYIIEGKRNPILGGEIFKMEAAE